MRNPRHDDDRGDYDRVDDNDDNGADDRVDDYDRVDDRTEEVEREKRGGRGERMGGVGGGSWMMVVGWGLGILMLTLVLGGFLERRDNPNRLSVLAGQSGHLVLLRGPGGHYRAEGRLNGAPANFLLDTGATRLAVPLRMAERAGLERGAPMMIRTANGVVRAWQTRVARLEIGPLIFEDLAAVIAPNLGGDEALLGMNALGDLHLEQRGEELILRVPE